MRTRAAMLVMAAVVAGILGMPARATAFGREGHAVVAKIADKYLSDKARDAIKELLAEHEYKSLADERLPNWADAIKGSAMLRRKYEDNGMWHYIDVDVDVPFDKLKIDDYRKDGKCALDALKRCQEVLKDPNKPIQDRREALFFIAHIIGDLHQPLHCAERNNDKGGNLVRVQLPGEKGGRAPNLHAVWDGKMVRMALGELTPNDFVTRRTNALTPEKRQEYQKGTLEDWILEGNKLAREKVYKDKGEKIPTEGEPYMLSEAYLKEGGEVVDVQLVKGGCRLAQFLNDTFK
jgi:hypothetical protein